MKSVSIQQPEHAPWLGFFYKMHHVDTTVLFDTVQFKKRYFDNRNKIRISTGTQWITIPVLSKGKYTQIIKDVRVNQTVDWKRQYLATLAYNYKSAPFYSCIFPEIERIIQSTTDRLCDLNYGIIRFCCDYLGIKTKLILASDLPEVNASSTELLLEICKGLRAHTYICGMRAMDYMNVPLFEEADIRIEQLTYTARSYPQLHPGFEPNLSVFDALFNLGPEAIKLINE